MITKTSGVSEMTHPSKKSLTIWAGLSSVFTIIVVLLLLGPKMQMLTLEATTLIQTNLASQGSISCGTQTKSVPLESKRTPPRFVLLSQYLHERHSKGKITFILLLFNCLSQ